MNCLEYGGVNFNIAGFALELSSVEYNVLNSSSVGGSTYMYEIPGGSLSEKLMSDIS